MNSSQSLRSHEFFWDELKKVVLSPLFLIVLALKVLASSFLASGFLSDLFLPFVDGFLSAGGNPYDRFWLAGHGDSFPYPTLMLAVFSLPHGLLGWVSPDFLQHASPLSLLTFRLPLLAADFVIFMVLIRWLRRQSRKVVVFYWCSPVLFYISYIHGQLDAVPIMLLFLSFYQIFRERWFLGALFLGLSLATKTNIVLVLPFYFVYLFLNKVALRSIVASGLIVLTTFVAINLPFLFSQGFLQMVFFNKEQSKALDLVVDFGPQFQFLLVPACYLVLFLRSLTYKSFNRDIFLMYVGFAFCAITALIPPMPGWYFWTVPLLVYFYVREGSRYTLFFYLLNGLYFLFFAIVPTSDFLKVFQFVSPAWAQQPPLYDRLVGLPVRLLVDLVLTALQTTLVLNALWIYRVGVSSNVSSKIKSTPYLIGLGGDSGVGKSTVSALVQGVFGEKKSLVLRGDDMHKWERGDSNWKRYTHLNPKANQLHLDLGQILDLKNGKTIQRQHYDHDRGQFTESQAVSARNIILVEGLHPFYVKKMRDLFDLKVFLRPDEDLRRHWKIQRDVSLRGHTKPQVLASMEARTEDASQFVVPQEQYADIVISFQPTGPIVDLGGDEPIDLVLNIRFGNDVSIEGLLARLQEVPSLTASHYYDFENQVLEVSGRIAAHQIGKAAFELVPELEELNVDPVWEEDYNGLIQLFLSCYVFEKIRLDGAF